jgi:hypothetical protein
MGAIPRLSPHTPLHTHATQQNNWIVIASEAKQSMVPIVDRWIASSLSLLAMTSDISSTQ